MVLGNPHFPWDGPERFFQAQLTIPGKVDVAGGEPVRRAGGADRTTRNLAWSHTVSTAFRFTPFEVKLVPGAPTTYWVDGQPLSDESGDGQVTVEVRRRASSGRARSTRQYGPVFTSLLGLPLFPWTSASAFSDGRRQRRQLPLPESLLRDEPGPERRAVRHDIRAALPGDSLGQLDRRGFHRQGLLRGHRRDPQRLRRQGDSPAVRRWAWRPSRPSRLPVLDGSRSSCDWDDDPDAVGARHLRTEPTSPRSSVTTT